MGGLPNHIDWSHSLGSDLIACSLGLLGLVHNMCLICGASNSIYFLSFVLGDKIIISVNSFRMLDCSKWLRVIGLGSGTNVELGIGGIQEDV